jgi:hypothetical protein
VWTAPDQYRNVAVSVNSGRLFWIKVDGHFTRWTYFGEVLLPVGIHKVEFCTSEGTFIRSLSIGDREQYMTVDSKDQRVWITE